MNKVMLSAISCTHTCMATPKNLYIDHGRWPCTRRILVIDTFLDISVDDFDLNIVHLLIHTKRVISRSLNLKYDRRDQDISSRHVICRSILRRLFFVWGTI